MAGTNVKYLAFDIESIADGELVSQVRYPGEGLTPGEAIARYRAERLEATNTDFIPYTFHIPVSVVVAKIDSKFRLLDLVSLDESEHRPHIIVEHFWRGWAQYRHPTFVTFNGRSYDLPLLELCTFRYGVSVPGWFRSDGPAYDQPRNRYNRRAHVDLQEMLTNFGATRGMTGGLNLASKLLGKPGKMDTQGDMVQELFDDGQIARIDDYCRCDVLDTYFVFLRWQVVTGDLSLEEEQVIVGETREWLESRSDDYPIYQSYLANWGTWHNPWLTAAEQRG